MVKFYVIEGLIGAGKSTLLKGLKTKYKNDRRVEIWEEPVDEFNNYNGLYHPLDIFYLNPTIEAPFVQLHIINVLKKYYERKIANIKSETEYIFTERSLFSPIIFSKTHYDLQYITEFQLKYLNDQALLNLQTVDNVIDYIIYINTSISTCHKNIQSRSRLSETKYDDILPYLDKLSFHYNDFIMKFQKNHGANSINIIDYKNIDEIIKDIENFVIGLHHTI